MIYSGWEWVCYVDLLRADKLLGKVSLSPQRRSFQRGCSWKEKNLANSNTSSRSSAEPGTPPAASPLKTSQSDPHFTFDTQKSHPYNSNTQRHSSASTTTTNSTTTTTPRVIHHTPLRDRDHLDSRSDNRKGWDSGGHENNWNKSSRNSHVSCVSWGVGVGIYLALSLKLKVLFFHF